MKHAQDYEYNLRNELIRFLYAQIDYARERKDLEDLDRIIQHARDLVDPMDGTTIWSELSRWIWLKIDAPSMGREYGPGIKSLEPALFGGAPKH